MITSYDHCHYLNFVRSNMLSNRLFPWHRLGHLNRQTPRYQRSEVARLAYSMVGRIDAVFSDSNRDGH